jgi:hypothetical protein
VLVDVHEVEGDVSESEDEYEDSDEGEVTDINSDEEYQIVLSES